MNAMFMAVAVPPEKSHALYHAVLGVVICVAVWLVARIARTAVDIWEEIRRVRRGERQSRKPCRRQHGGHHNRQNDQEHTL